MYGYLYLRQAPDGTLLARLRMPETGENIDSHDWTLQEVGRGATDTRMREVVNEWLAEIGWQIEPDQLALLADNEPVLASGPERSA